MTTPTERPAPEQRLRKALEAMTGCGEWEHSSRNVVMAHRTEDWPTILITISANKIMAPKLRRYLQAVSPSRVAELLEANEAQARRIKELEAALRGLIEVIDAAGLHNLSNGVQLGPTVWYVKAHDCMEYANAVLAPSTAPHGGQAA